MKIPKILITYFTAGFIFLAPTIAYSDRSSIVNLVLNPPQKILGSSEFKFQKYIRNICETQGISRLNGNYNLTREELIREGALYLLEEAKKECGNNLEKCDENKGIKELEKIIKNKIN